MQGPHTHALQELCSSGAGFPCQPTPSHKGGSPGALCPFECESALGGNWHLRLRQGLDREGFPEQFLSSLCWGSWKGRSARERAWTPQSTQSGRTGRVHKAGTRKDNVLAQRRELPTGLGARTEIWELAWALRGNRVAQATRERSLHGPVRRSERHGAWKGAR